MNNQMNNKEYINGSVVSGSKCPKCGSDMIEGSSWNVDRDSATQEMSCLDCDYSYLDIYRLAGYCDSNGEESEGKPSDPEPQVAIVVEGGLIQDVLSNIPGKVIASVFYTDPPELPEDEVDWKDNMDALEKIQKDESFGSII